MSDKGWTQTINFRYLDEGAGPTSVPGSELLTLQQQWVWREYNGAAVTKWQWRDVPIVTVAPTPPPAPPPITPSPNLTTIIAPSSAVITDAAGNTWGISAAGQVSVNGSPYVGTANVIELAYVNGLVYQENASQLWWSITGPTAQWVAATNPLT